MRCSSVRSHPTYRFMSSPSRHRPVPSQENSFELPLCFCTTLAMPHATTSLATTDLFPVSTILSFQECYIHRIAGCNHLELTFITKHNAPEVHWSCYLYQWLIPCYSLLLAFQGLTIHQLKDVCVFIFCYYEGCSHKYWGTRFNTHWWPLGLLLPFDYCE